MVFFRSHKLEDKRVAGLIKTWYHGIYKLYRHENV